jgi:hypothetical protein
MVLVGITAASFECITTTHIGGNTGAKHGAGSSEAFDRKPSWNVSGNRRLLGEKRHKLRNHGG